MRTQDLTTPALVLDDAAFTENLRTMAQARPGDRLRPHVKAHKCTALAMRQAEMGHRSFTCATISEVEGMAAAGLGDDLLLANEVLDARRLGALRARITVAVDSRETLEAAVRGGVDEVVIDVNVGMRRCGCKPEAAGELAEIARSRGLSVRGVMGYEGHVVGLSDRKARREGVEQAMARLATAASDVGGLISAGGTGSYDLNTLADEIQAGSYALMDAAYGKLDIPFRQALFVLATVIHISQDGYVVANAGLKALGMDQGMPSIEGGGEVLMVSDEHLAFIPTVPLDVGAEVRVIPGHCDPTIAYHEAIHLVDGDRVLEKWDVDLRGW